VLVSASGDNEQKHKDTPGETGTYSTHEEHIVRTTIIGLTGQAGSGKDPVSSLLVCRAGVYRLAFADHLKLEAMEAFDANALLFIDPTLKSVATDDLALRNCREAGYVSANWGLANLAAVTPRSIMQTWGDWRRSQDPDYFVTKLDARIDRAVQLGAKTLIITDVRFRNEAALIRRYGGQLWRIARPGLARPSGHRSEWDLADEPVDAEIINDGSIEQLTKIVTDLLLSAQARVVELQS